jgi:hypothetical protein
MRPSQLFALVLPALALGTTLIPHTLLQRAEQADRVALVQVLSQRVEETAGAPVSIKTYTRVAVGDDFRGTGPSEVTIVQLGGTIGPKSIEVPGDAHFTVGETAVVFLRCRLAVDRCHLVAMDAGKLEVSGDQVFIRDLFTGTWTVKRLAELAAELGGKR